MLSYKNKLFSFFCSVICLITTSYPTYSETDHNDSSFKILKISLGKVLPNTKLFGLTTDFPMSTHVAYAAKVGGKMAVYYDGKKGEEFDSIAAGTPFFIHGSSQLVYIAIEDGGQFIVVGNKKGHAFKGVSDICFSLDGKHCMYRAQNGTKQLVVVDDNKGEEYDKIPGVPIFSLDSRRFAYPAVSKDKQWYLVVNDKKYGPFQGMKDIIFSPDSKHITCSVLLDKEWHLFNDGKVGKGYENVSYITWSSNSTSFSYVAQEKKKFFIVENGNEQKRYSNISPPKYSFDSRHLVYPAQNGTKWFMVFDKKEGSSFDILGMNIFSPDSNQFAYFAQKGGKIGVVSNFNNFEKYDFTDFLSFSPDSLHLAYKAKQADTVFVVRDGKKEKNYLDVGRIFFSPNSMNLVYMAVILGGKAVMVVNGKEGRPYDITGNPVFSPSGKHIAYTAKREKKWLWVVDGREIELNISSILDIGPIVFDSENSLHGLGVLNTPGPEFFRFEVSLID